MQASDADGYLDRTFMSPASLRAGNLIRGWMEDAGLRTLALYLFMLETVLEVRLMFMLISSSVDQLGNLHGRVEGMNASAKALLIGFHLVMLFFFFTIFQFNI